MLLSLSCPQYKVESRLVMLRSVNLHAICVLYRRVSLSVFIRVSIGRWPGLAVTVGLDQRSYSTTGSVSTWMDDRLQGGKPSWFVANHLGRLGLLSSVGR